MFTDNIIRVTIGERFRYIDKNGNVIIPDIKCDYIADFCEDLAKIDTGLWGYIDKTGTRVIACQYDRCSDFNNGLAAVRTKYTCQVDDSGKEVVEDKTKGKKNFWTLSYDEKMEVLNFISNAKYQTRYKWHFIDKKGNSVTPDIYIDYESVMPVNKTLWEVCNSEWHYGLVDSKWKEIIPCIYNYLVVRDGLIEVELDGKYGVLDERGNAVIPIIYDRTIVENGLIWVRSGAKCGVFDKNGNAIIPVIYDNTIVGNGLITVRQGEKWGLFDEHGSVIVPIIYDDIRVWDGLVKLNGIYGLCKYSSNLSE